MAVFGTRPEATKMAPVIKALKARPDWFDVTTVVTGQHKEQLYQAMDAFSLKPDLDLAIMKESQTVPYVISESLRGLDAAISGSRPDVMAVHGDTATAVAASLAACYGRVPLAHVEAGLRSFVKDEPWPEEISRVIVDAMADVHLAPLEGNRRNLLEAGVRGDSIYITGQTQVDAAMAVYDESHAFPPGPVREAAERAAKGGRVILVTAHRRESLGAPMKGMFAAIRRVADESPDATFVYPMHLSPAVREAAGELLSGHPRIRLIEPLGYADMVNLIARSYMVMSDSGGLQEECPAFGVPLLLMRRTTERPEGVEAGVTALCGVDGGAIHAAAMRLLRDPGERAAMSGRANPFGDGRASGRVAQALAHYLGLTAERPADFRP